MDILAIYGYKLKHVLRIFIEKKPHVTMSHEIGA